ncbi:MAG: 2-hydroxyacid dehydrogenase [Chloroflexi bacterium]|nr:2-hydroxyacid dehydrogenase [Chloroflexota bacterium]
MDAEVRAIADQLRPRAFEFRNVAATDLPDALMDADYLCGFIGPIETDVLVAAAGKRLKLVQLMSAGYDRFNIEGARAAYLPVADNGGANAIAVAEHAVMLVLSALKHVHALDAAVRQGRWRGGVGRVYELYGSTVGIVGMGRIGREVAKRLAGWEADIVYYDPVRLAPEVEQQLKVTYRELDQVLRVADAVTVHVPLNASTRNLIDAESLSLMKSTAVLVNTARGGLVDEAALADVLRQGQILGAGLDVFSQEPIGDSPLLELPNVILTPHSAGPTWQSFPRRFANCFANIERVQRGEKPQWVVEELSDLFSA